MIYIVYFKMSQSNVWVKLMQTAIKQNICKFNKAFITHSCIFSELPENQKKLMHPKSLFLTHVINHIHSFDLFKPA